MTRASRYILLTAIAAMTACTDELPMQSPAAPDEYIPGLEGYDFMIATEETYSRTVYTDHFHSEFADKDRLGAFSLQYPLKDSDLDITQPATGWREKEENQNSVYTVHVLSNLNPDGDGTDIQRLQVLAGPEDGTALTIQKGGYLLYYPYDEAFNSAEFDHDTTTPTTTNFANLAYSVKIDQRKDEDFEKSDLLWDVVTTENSYTGDKIEETGTTETSSSPIKVYMDHVMATIVVKIDRDSIDSEYGVRLLNLFDTAWGVDLTRNVHLAGGATSVDASSPTQLCAKGHQLRCKYTASDADGNTSDADRTKSINMHVESFNDSYDKDIVVFRAAVPAYQTIAKGQEIIDVMLINERDATTGSILTSPTKYKTTSEIKLLPGHNYIFNLHSGKLPAVQDVTDEDSWVLDVVDPDTGKPVGLLCREYIYWAPEEYATNYRGCAITDGDYKFEINKTNLRGLTNGKDEMLCMIATNPASQELLEQVNANGKYNMSIENTVPAINSQVWVFYNLKSGSSQPDLTKGTILRFIYDMKAGGGHPGYTPYIHPKYSHISTTHDFNTKAAWPYPHSGTSDKYQGIFKVTHGHEYVTSQELGMTDIANMYGVESVEYLEYYMHGGVITWDPNNNIVDKFFMPEAKITNYQASVNGHIAIRTDENGQKTAFVSYTPCVSETLDEDGNAVGQRIVKKMTVGNKSYPLRKVGFNQFWSGKSLSSTTDNEGNELECFNVPGGVGAVNYSSFYTTEPEDGKKYDQYAIIPAGYIYPTAVKGQQDQQGVKHDFDFDPYADPSLRESVALLYSFAAFTEGKLKPANTADESYRFPTVEDMIRLRRYGGVLFAAKWITDHIRTKLPDETYVESTYEGLKNGMLLKNDSYCANISGLDLRAFGMKGPKDERVVDLGNRNYFYLDATTDFPYEKKFEDAMGDPVQLANDPMAWIEIFQFSPWDCWGSNPISNYIHGTHTIQDLGKEWKRAHSRTFAPIRVIMSYTNPIGDGASTAEMEYMNRSIPMMMPREMNTSKEINVNIVKSESRK